MQVASVSMVMYCPQNLLSENKNDKNNKKPSGSYLPLRKSFRGSPWNLDQSDIAHKITIKACEAIDLHKLLSCGNYLDLNGENKDTLKADRKIRRDNLSFLDKVTEPEEKREFVEYYKDTTGFPNLCEVANNILDTFISAVKLSQRRLQGGYGEYTPSGYEVLACGYDGVSSVAKKMALPGSDLDKAFVIVKGLDFDDEDTDGNRDIVNEFKGQLWENTDQDRKEAHV